MTPRNSPQGAPDHDWTAGAQPLTRYVERGVQWVRAFDRRRPLVWDLLLTGFFVVVNSIDVWSGGWRNIAPNDKVDLWIIGTMTLAFSVPLLWRRRHPLAVYGVMVLAMLVNNWTGAMLQASLILLVVLFNIATRLPARTLAWSYGLLAVPLVVGHLRHPQGGWDQQVIPTMMSFAIVALMGIAFRTRQEYMASLVQRAKQLEVERDQQAQLATNAERTRIAREMHDIIGHNLSVITTLADGGSYAAAKSPERAAQALTAIGATSRQALTELRRLLDVLREEAPETAALAPQPSLTDLDQLIDGVRAAGLPVRSTVHGHPDSLPAGRQLTLYRVVQEALTNTLKHGGPGATATVEVTYGDDGVRVRVTDTGVGGSRFGSSGRGLTSPGRGLTSSGRGLTGMRERTALYGGTLEAGPLPHPQVGWHVELRLPKEPAQ
ncbi:sensor histidine kinase [Streptomyces sp. NBC_01283]|uniref:sensor histidine kinase n=1 Tax=Streptomyces sp. NBC_01283 TaxID=2903812 RepID=UPI00352E3838|nr:sensor histidine kinase [Streptomyces sp. NBC_01283]